MDSSTALSATTERSMATSACGSLPGIIRRLIVAVAEPGITLARKPPLMITGALVWRMSAGSGGSRLTAESARRARAASSPTTSRKNPDIGGVLVRDSVVKNCLVDGVIVSGVSYVEIFASARDSAEMALSGLG